VVSSQDDCGELSCEAVGVSELFVSVAGETFGLFVSVTTLYLSPARMRGRLDKHPIALRCCEQWGLLMCVCVCVFVYLISILFW